MKIKNRIISSILSLCLAASMAIPAFAVPEIAPDKAVDGVGGTASAEVLLTAEASNFSVTVPMYIPVHVNADGTVTCPEPFSTQIYNNSVGAVKVTGIAVNEGAWTLADYNGGSRDELAKEPVNARKLGMELSVTGDSAATTGAGNQTLTHDASKWIVNPRDSLRITTAAIATAVSGEIAEPETAASVVFTIGWNTAN